MIDTQASDIVEHALPLPFDDTVERVIAAIANAGMTPVASIDRAANARRLGATRPPSKVLIYGSGKGGTPIMLVIPRAAGDLPLRLLIRQAADGRIMVAFHPVAVMLRCVGMPEEGSARLEPAQRMLLAAITS